VTNSQTHVTQLINDFKLETYAQYDKGRHILETNGEIITYNSSIPRVSLGGLLDLQRMLFKINRNANKLTTMEPFKKIEQAQQFDASNLNYFLYKNSFSKVSRSIVNAALRTVFGLEPEEINTLFGLMYVKSGGTIESLTLTDPNCAQEKRVKGGTQQISQRLLDYILSFRSNRILLNSPIERVDQSDSKIVTVTVKTADNKKMEFHGRKLVSSIPLNQYCKIEFVPDLPLFKRNVLSSCKMGNYMKIAVTYKKAFWREKGYSGAVVSDGSIVYHKDLKQTNGTKLGPLAIVYDATSDEGEPALIGFVCGQAAVTWYDQDAAMRKREIIEALIRYFGVEAGDFVEFFEKNWSMEPFTGGCPTVNVVCSGAMKDYARATREPFLNTHFCGTESATQWQGYMDGAVESGIRVASEILYDSYSHLDNLKDNLHSLYQKTYYYQMDELKRYREKHMSKNSNNSIFMFVFLLFLALAIGLCVCLDGHKVMSFFGLE
jgi:monoamine oxidase